MTAHTPKIVGYWLLIGALLVILMVVIGGITRLTHSGLSMVTWKPVTGIVPPLSEEDWESRFDNYKTSPEYTKRNYHFSLEDFKSIFWWEYIHRLVGRLIGVVFIIPFCYFLFTKKLRNKKLQKNLAIIFVLGGIQGVIGWLMVKSGLVDDPDVSHYRLAIHLSTALFLSGYILWIALGVFSPHSSISKSETTRIGKLLRLLLLLISCQIVYGAFVAGLKAGLFYPTFPKMGNEWFPQTAVNAMNKGGIMSFFEHPVIVQFIHRWMAVIVLGMAIWLFIESKRINITINQQKAIVSIVVLVALQFLLGVFTLLFAVPVSLGVLHQLGAVLLLLSVITAMFFFKKRNQVFSTASSHSPIPPQVQFPQVEESRSSK